MKLLLLFAIVTAKIPENDFFILEEAQETEWRLSASGFELCSVAEHLCHPLLFQATKEWQVIKPGQRIPKGLHVTMDYSTGVKMAKLLDGGEKDNAYEVAEVADPASSAPNIHKPQDLDESSNVEMKKKALNSKEKSSLDLLFNQLEDSSAIEAALETLADAGHDMYVGIGVAFEKEYIDKLVNLLRANGSNIIRAKSAQVLITITSNNPLSIKHIQKHSPNFISELMAIFKQELNSSGNCKVCIKRIIMIISMIIRLDNDALRAFVNTKPFETLLDAVKQEDNMIKDRIYTILDTISESGFTDSLEIKNWYIQLKREKLLLHDEL